MERKWAEIASEDYVRKKGGTHHATWEDWGDLIVGVTKENERGYDVAQALGLIPGIT